MEQVQTYGQLAKVVVSCESEEVCCRKDRKIDFSDLVLVKKVEIEMVKGRQHSIWEEVSKNGLASQGFSLLGQDLEIDTDKKPNKKGLFYATLKNLLKVGRPTTEFSKGPNLVGQPTFEVLIGTRVCGGLPDVDYGRPNGMFLASSWGRLYRH